MKKINWKWLNGVLVLFLFVLLLYTRFINLSWGLPYPFHPDERNMAVALQQLHCSTQEFRITNYEFWKECLNPHFFAYGQFPLYVGYFLIQFFYLFSGQLRKIITFEEATMSLRILSAVSSVGTVFVGLKIIEFLVAIRHSIKRSANWRRVHPELYKDPGRARMTKNYLLLTLVVFTFSPGLIQFAHFGTTESLLMVFYMSILYVSLLFQKKKIHNSKFIILNSLFSGLAIATKVSSLIFLAVPVVTILIHFVQKLTKKTSKHARNDRIKYILDSARTIVIFIFLTMIVSFIFSPHNILSFQDFLNTFHYESDVGLGLYLPFYTRQFFQTVPLFFQMQNIFPYALGWPVFLLFLAGFFSLPWNKHLNLLRFGLLAYVIPTAFIYTKWTRFMAPIFPLMIIFASLFVIVILDKVRDLSKRNASLLHVDSAGRVLLVVIGLLFVITPGVTYLSVFQQPDVRFQASEWIYQHIPQNSYILSETGNVVDIPMPVPQSLLRHGFAGQARLNVRNYNIISFDFYNLDENPLLLEELRSHIEKADYILIPSRRIFVNHTCMSPRGINVNTKTSSRCKLLQEKYPLLNEYYKKLFSGELGFQLVAEITSYPAIKFGNRGIETPDENAEETWSVFDHPVVRIYKRIYRGLGTAF